MKVISPYFEKYEKLYSCYSSRVKQYANSFLKDMEEANNITNDTFLSLWENKERINWNENVMSWIFLVAKNKCINVLKKRIQKCNYSNSRIQEKKDYLNYLAIQSDVPENIYTKELEILLEKALNTMSPKVRDTFLMSRMKGLKYYEIAQINNISCRAVEARIKLAMLILRKTFKDYL